MSAVNSMPYVKAIGWGLLLGGIAIFGLTATMNYLQGDLWGVTEGGKIVNRWSAVIIDAVGIVVCGFAAGTAIAASKRGWALGLTGVMLLSAAASIYSMASFQATERMSAAKSRADIIAHTQRADKLAEDQIKWTRGSSLRADGRTERRDYLRASSDELKRFRETKVEAAPLPDAGAQIWATISGWSLDRIQMIQAAYLAVLLIILKMVCFQAAGFFLNPLAWLQAEGDRKISGSSQGSGGQVKTQPEKIKQDEKIVPIRASQLEIEQPPKVRRVESGAPQLSASERVRDAIAKANGQVSLQAIAAASRASLATVSRVTRDMEGKGKLKRKRRGRQFQVASNRRLNGGTLHVFG